jgi:hypothetical protein
MAVKKTSVKPKQKRESSADKLDKSLNALLVQVESLAKERIDQARDALKVGRKIADQIRAIADRVENEVIADGMAKTEAYSSQDAVGVGIGVL